MKTAYSRHPNGFSLVELLVSIAIIGALVAMLLPAVLYARATTRRMSCQNNLRQLGLALQNYQSAHGAFPPSNTAANGVGTGICEPEEVEVADNPGKCTEHQSWTALCLPFIEQDSLSSKYHFDQPWSSLDNRAAVSTQLKIFQCPASPLQNRTDTHHVVGAAASDYAAINQVESRVFTDVFGVLDPGMAARQGALTEHESTPPQRISDGLSNTLLVSECAGRPESYVLESLMTAAQFASYTDDEIIVVDGQYTSDDGIGWADPDSGIAVKGVSENGTEVFGARMINGINAGEAFSFHNGGAQFLFADGSVHFLNQDIEPWLFVSLCTRAGSEVVEGY